MAENKKPKKEKKPKKSGNKGKNGMVVVIALLIFLLLSISVGFFFIFKNLNAPISAVEVTKQTEIKPKEMKLITLESPIYTNLLTGQDNKDHLIRISVGIGVDYTEPKKSDTLITLINDRMAIVQDIIVSVCRSKTYEELRTSDAQEVLKAEILSKMQEEFGSNLIYRIIINEILLQ